MGVAASPLPVTVANMGFKGFPTGKVIILVATGIPGGGHTEDLPIYPPLGKFYSTKKRAIGIRPALEKPPGFSVILRIHTFVLFE